MRPIYRHGVETPWGGDGLKTLFNKAIPDDLTGESLEISALPGMDSVVENGELAGTPLGKVYATTHGRLTGLPDEAGFPLLVKLLDARDMLSVQVHPGDDYAAQRHGKLGKTEAWVVLDAPPGAKLVLGLKEGVSLQEAVSTGTLESALSWLTVSRGDVLYIPHGLVHALGNGIRVYEIQQSSDVTYRLWDWDRTGPDGKKRALHTQDALAVARPLTGGKLSGVTLEAEGGRQTVYISDGNFELWRLDVNGRMPLAKGQMRLITSLGSGTLGWEGGNLSLLAGDSVLVPADTQAWVEGDLSLLMSLPGDRVGLKALLGDRAGQVAGLNEEET